MNLKSNLRAGCVLAPARAAGVRVKVVVLVLGVVAVGLGIGAPLGAVAGGAAGVETNEVPWSFAPVMEPEVPAVKDGTWPATSVDGFVLAGMEARGLRPVAEADRRTLIRRATFDLTGLPPTPEEVEAFEADAAPGAYERVVERLLGSPRYGERWGRHWLDVVRYADTAGDTADYPVLVAWRYRNWVIEAFNADKPYDEFLREQIAGDILAGEGPRERYAERVTATGFLAISRRFGFDSENYHHLTLQDTLDTVGQAVLGLTLGCARCHDHKFDPVTMADYYALYGIFASTRYPFPGSEQKGKSRAMVPLVPPDESQPLWREHDRRVAELADRLARAKRPVPSATYRSLHDPDGDFEMQKEAAGGSYGVLVPPWLAEGAIGAKTSAQSPFRDRQPGGRVGAAIAGGPRDYRLEQALFPRRTADSTPVLEVNLDFRVTPPAGLETTAPHRFRLGPGPGPGAGLPLLEFLLAAEAFSMRTAEGWERLTALRPGGWHHLQLTVDLRNRTVSGRVEGTNGFSAFAARPFVSGAEAGIGHVTFDSGARAGGTLPELELDNFGVEAAGLATLGARSTDGEPATEETARDLVRRLVEGPVPMAYAVVEGTPHDERLQRRGEPDRPAEVVPRGFIRALGGGPLPSDTRGSGRRELAEWLTRPGNPLTSRVMANRLWTYHFGRGLVATPNDFGSRGVPPKDPALLDHLASRLVRNGWSLKAMHRLIMRSATYRQGTTPAGVGAAEEEAWVGFPRRRLDAEELRDSILAVSGQLEEAPGAGHPFPSPVESAYSQHGPFSAVYEHRRRSVYLMTQRLKRHPFLALFDGPDPNSSTAARGTTTVPTQALYFLNNPFVHSQSESWAGRLLAACDTDTDSDTDTGPGTRTGTVAGTDADPDLDVVRVKRAWRQAIGRAPTGVERDEAKAFLAAYRAEMPDPGGAAAGRQALAAYLRALLGSNEFLHID